MADGEKGVKPPEELRLAWMQKKFPGSLPDAGALYDQDYVLLSRMQIFSNIYDAVSHYRSLSGDAINKQLSNQERLLLGELQKMGLLRGLNRG